MGFMILAQIWVGLMLGSIPIGQKINDNELERVNLRRDHFQGN